MGGRRQVRIAHAEIDDIGAGIPCRCLGLVDLFEDVRRQTADAVEIFHRSRAPDASKAGVGCTFGSKAESGSAKETCSLNDLGRFRRQTVESACFTMQVWLR